MNEETTSNSSAFGLVSALRTSAWAAGQTTQTTAQQLLELDEDTVGFALLALYELVDDYDGFCEWLDLDPDLPDVFDFWLAVHASYIDTWNELGDLAFARQLKEHQRYLI